MINTEVPHIEKSYEWQSTQHYQKDCSLHNFIIAEDGVQEMEETEDPAGEREIKLQHPLE